MSLISKVIVLAVMIALQQEAFANNPEGARKLFWWTSIVTAIMATTVVTTTAMLTSYVSMANDNVKQTPGFTPQENLAITYQAKNFENALNAAYVSTGMAFLEVIIPVAVFYTSYKKKDQLSGILSMLYFAPALLSTAMMGWSITTVRTLCDKKTACWEPPSCVEKNNCAESEPFVAIVTAWGVLRGFSYVAPLISIMGACCVADCP